jgi:protein phosphatase
MEYDIWGHSDRGRRRRENQDAILFSTLGDEQKLPKLGISAEKAQTHGHLLAVADGVGGVRGGREASELLINYLAQTYYETVEQSAEERLQTAIVQANAIAVQQNRHENASSTLVAAAIYGGKLFVAHVGDSRAYLVRHGQIQQLTEDHALGNRLTRYLVSTNEFLPTMHPTIKLEVGDRVLLCSDGLFRPIKEQSAILDILQNYHAEEATYRLIGLANAGGGYDNISVVLAYVDAPQRTRRRGKWESL